jgi:hypothetical protein
MPARLQMQARCMRGGSEEEVIVNSSGVKGQHESAPSLFLGVSSSALEDTNANGCGIIDRA